MYKSQKVGSYPWARIIHAVVVIAPKLTQAADVAASEVVGNGVLVPIDARVDVLILHLLREVYEHAAADAVREMSLTGDASRVVRWENASLSLRGGGQPFMSAGYSYNQTIR